MKDDKKFTWSKGALFCSGTIFLSVVILVFWLYISGNIKNVYDTTLLVTLVTVSGSIFGSNLVWYSKKSGGENQYKLRIHMYEESAKVRLDYNEKMMKLSRQYNMTREDIDQIDSSGEMDENMRSAFDNINEGLNNSQSEFDSPNSLENF